MNYSHFFVFGCWNRDNCSGNRLDYRKAVIHQILEKKDYFDFGIIAGDNIYPHKKKEKKEDKTSTVDEKEKKEKKYYQSTLDYGFDLLQQLKYNTNIVEKPTWGIY